MKKTAMLGILALVLLLGGSRTAGAHCEVPCGIYDDEARFTAMVEDAQTIQKAMKLIADLSKPHEEMSDALRLNQLSRWVATKEQHATNTMDVIGQYFMAQRIKPDAKNYVEQLKAAHAVTRAAMKCKQTVEPANAKALELAIAALKQAYTQG